MSSADNAATQVNDLATKLKDVIVIGEGGKIEVPKSIYKDNLPEDVTLAQAKSLQQYQTNFVHAAHKAVGETCTAAAVKDKTLESAEAKIDLIGHDKLTIGWERQKLVTNRNPATGEVTEETKFGVTNGAIRISGVRNANSALKEIRTELQSAAKSALEKAMK